jgi:hypothetical protein
MAVITTQQRMILNRLRAGPLHLPPGVVSDAGPFGGAPGVAKGTTWSGPVGVKVPILNRTPRSVRIPVRIKFG